MRFAGRAVIVTGAGSGIGAASARAFASEGAAVVVVDREADAVTRVADAIVAGGGKAVAHVADVRDEAAVVGMVRSAGARFGGVHVLHNNVGHGTFARIADTSLEAWEATVTTTLTTAFLCTKHVVPLMVSQRQGAIVNTASVAGFVAQDGLAAYCAAKAGLLALTRSTAIEYAPHGVRANCVVPGTIATPAIMAWPEERRAQVARAHPAGRLGTPEEVAAVVLFLASDAAAFVTGAAYQVDGGSLAGRGVSLMS